jgi:acetylornithine deacetylase
MENAVQRTIESSVDQLDGFAIDLLRDLVRIPSITGYETRAQEYVARCFSEMGMEVDVWSPTRTDVKEHPAFSDDGLPLGERPVVVARWRGTDAQSPSLILNGHIDVVPTGGDAAWAGGPWSGAVRDGRLFGRGSCDMKGGLVSGIWAVASLQKRRCSRAAMF